MTQLPTLLRHLEAYVQEEIGAQGRSLAVLEAQERAVLSSAPEAIAAATSALEKELASAPRRARRRAELLRGFAQIWGLAPGVLTLTSLIERAGPDGERLQRQRAELRQATGRVARKARRISAAARAHQRLTAEILATVLAHGSGSLVDAEA